MASLSAHFRRQLSGSAKSHLESLNEGDPGAESLSTVEIRQILEQAKTGLNQLKESYPEALQAGLDEITDLVRRKGESSLQAVANQDDDHLIAHPETTQLLEVIVNTDGSRPSFLVQKDKVDYNSSPAGEWRDIILTREDALRTAIQCTGRVNKGEIQIGTGFLVTDNLIVTNRHVLQAIGSIDGNGWSLDRGANIDFGHEFRGRKSVNRRQIRKVVYTGPQEIDIHHVDHRLLDLAVLELEAVDDDLRPREILQWDTATGWEDPGVSVFIIGYPGDPKARGIQLYTAPLLNQLFAFQFGCKRLAPGKIIPSDIPGELTFAHDATTLGGNSGSLIVILSAEDKACGLHYGGDTAVPKQNWGHSLGKAMNTIGNTRKDLIQQIQHAQD